MEKIQREVTLGQNCRNISNSWKGHGHKRRHCRRHIPFSQKWLTSHWQTASVITLQGDEKDSALDQWHFRAFDLIIHIHGDEQQRAQTGAAMKVSTFLRDKGVMISARSQRWCHILLCMIRPSWSVGKKSKQWAFEFLLWTVSLCSSVTKTSSKKRLFCRMWKCIVYKPSLHFTVHPLPSDPFSFQTRAEPFELMASLPKKESLTVTNTRVTVKHHQI